MFHLFLEPNIDSTKPCKIQVGFSRCDSASSRLTEHYLTFLILKRLISNGTCLTLSSKPEGLLARRQRLACRLTDVLNNVFYCPITEQSPQCEVDNVHIVTYLLLLAESSRRILT